MIMAIAAVALTAYQLYQNGEAADAQQASLEEQRRIRERNAKFMIEDAWKIEQYAQTQEAMYDAQATNVMADQRLAMAYKGVDANYGTAADIQADTKVVSLLNKIQMRKDGVERATGLRKDAANARMGAMIDYKQGSALVDAQRNSGYAQAAQSGMQLYSRYGSDKK